MFQAGRRTDMTKLRVAFFADVPKKKVSHRL